MKKILLTLVLLVGIVFGLFAQNLTYQAVVRDNNQQLVVNTDVKATVTIDFATGEDPTWTVDATTNLHGLLSIEFGDATLKGRDWTGATIAVKVVNKNDESIVYVNDDERPVSAVPYALSVDGQSIQNYLAEHNYVDLDKLKDTLNAYPTTAVMDGRHYLRSDSAVITTMQSDIADLKAGQFDCNKVKECIKDTLEKYTPTTGLCDVLNDCLFPEQTLAELLQGLTNQISDLKEQVDSLSNLPHGGGGTTEVADGQPCPGAQTVKDIDGNTYNTVKIGSQCWTKENMKTTKYADDTDIDSIKVFNPNNSEDNVATYGKLYTWSAATRDSSTTYPTSGSKVQGICPAGWHVPSHAEWDTLTTYVKGKTEYRCGGTVDAIAKALSTTTGWSSNTASDCNAGNSGEKSNLTGFSAVPAGGRYNGSPEDFGSIANFWSATQYNDGLAWYRRLDGSASNVGKYGANKVSGFSVRCLRDAGIGGTTPSTPATMSCDDVMNCLGDTLGKLNDKIVAQGEEIATLNTTVTTQGQTIENLSNTVTEQNQTITTQGNTIDSLARIVDSLSNLSHGGGTTEVADGQPCPGAQTVKDIDGYTYNTVKIGSQCWTKENLRTTAGLTENTNYRHANGQSANDGTYGLLYNWAAVTKDASTTYPQNANDTLVHGICPTGWHVPSHAEWDTLTTYVNSKTEYKCGGADNAIAKALSTTTGWSSSSDSCYAGNSGEKSNATGFAAVPAGGYFGSSYGFNTIASFWSATQKENNNANAWFWGVDIYRSNVNSDNDSKTIYLSVRCLRDAGIGGTTPSTPATMSCDDVMNCLGDTLGKLNNKIEAQGQTITTQGNTIDSLAHIVDSLSNLSHGGGDTPTAFTCGTSKVKDVDNNEYPTVQIGSQCWMKENLRTTTKRNGVGNIYINNTKVGYNAETYGYYYDWAAVMQNESGDTVQGICPTGWHVPSNAEWTALTGYVNTEANGYRCNGSGNIAKALSTTTGWGSNTSEGCNAGNTGDKANATGFAAVPAGHCSSGAFDDFGYNAFFWSATVYDDNTAWCRGLYFYASHVDSYNDNKAYGFSVRCLRDAGIGGTPGENETGGTTPSTPATMSCDDVMRCMGDTLGKLNNKIEAQGQTITTQGNTIDSLAHIVDSLSNLSHGGGTTEVADGQPCPGAPTVKDVDNNEYPTVQIGSQCWTKENLRTNVDGSVYPKNGDNYVTGDDTVTYGRLYTWAAMMKGATSTNYPASGDKVQGICPAGWHVPSDAEWDTLTKYVYNSTNPDYKCSSCTSTGWEQSTSCIAKALASKTGWASYQADCSVGNTPENNDATGFSAVPAGACYTSGSKAFGSGAYFWSALQYDATNARYWRLSNSGSKVSCDIGNKVNGFSVRCLRDPE